MKLSHKLMLQCGKKKKKRTSNHTSKPNFKKKGYFLKNGDNSTECTISNQVYTTGTSPSSSSLLGKAVAVEV